MRHRLLRWCGPPLVALLLAGGMIGVYHLTLDPEVEARNRALADELLRVEARNARLRAEIEVLRADLQRLRSDEDEAVHQARTALGMVRPGETIYRFPPPVAGATAGKGPGRER